MALGGTLRTLWLFIMLTAILAVAGFFLGGYFTGDPVTGTLIFLVIAAAFNIITLFWGHKIVLKTYRAKVVDAHEAPRLHRIIDNICLRTGMPKPTIAVIPSDNPNAFATGRSPKNAVVAATVGILQILDDEELEGVMAHEMGHVKNRDMLVMTTAATIAGAISFAARMFFWSSLFGGGGSRDGPAGNPLILILVMITAPLAAILVQLSISRQREFKADHAGATITGKPWALARALQKLEAGNVARPMEGGNPAHSALFISNPFRQGIFAKLFSTHPSTAERVRRLEAMV